MKEIPLGQGKVTIVDDEDYEELARHNWRAVPRIDGKGWYVGRNASIGGGKYQKVYMHRTILDAKPKQVSDHINGDGLDNRRANLRLCTHAENHANQRKKDGASSRFKGVTWSKKQKKWVARIHISLGAYDNEEEAARAYDAKMKELYGEHARVNFDDV